MTLTNNPDDGTSSYLNCGEVRESSATRRSTDWLSRRRQDQTPSLGRKKRKQEAGLIQSISSVSRHRLLSPHHYIIIIRSRQRKAIRRSSARSYYRDLPLFNNLFPNSLNIYLYSLFPNSLSSFLFLLFSHYPSTISHLIFYLVPSVISLHRSSLICRNIINFRNILHQFFTIEV